MITKYNDFDNVVCDRSKYVNENNVICKCDEQLREPYTMEFNVDDINTLQEQFINVLQGIDHVTQHIVDSLYINLKNMLINPARHTGIYIENGNVKLNTLIRSLDVMVNKCGIIKCGIIKIVKFQGNNVCF